MDANYERLDNEIRNLRARVLELEHLYTTLARQYDALKKSVIGKEIDEYLANYKPKQDGTIQH